MVRGGEQHLVHPGALVTREDDLVGGAFLLGQDHLAARRVVCIGQNVLLLPRGGRLQRRDDLDLLAGLRIRHYLHSRHEGSRRYRI